MQEQILFIGKVVARVVFTLIVLVEPLVSNAQVRSIKEQIKDSVLISMLEGEHWYSTESIVLKSAVATDNNIRIRFNKTAETVIVSKAKLESMADSVREWTGLRKGNVAFLAEQKQLDSLLPHKWKMGEAKGSVVERTGEEKIDAELTGRTFAVWNSHGRYYERSLDRWEWQRARLFTTVEDLLSSSFVLPFLVPMLENAGANVFMPRERDTQSNISKAHNINGRISSTVPEEGEYAVYVKYGKGSGRIEYTVKHIGGTSTYIVDQTKGYDMWVFLGKHRFTREWSISINGDGDQTQEARLGGGMGTIARNGQTSGMPAWMEGARYYLEADGFDAKTVYALSEGTNDYTDDINGRGEWVNALIKTKNINIDASIALHTDAGFATRDTTIGTLTIVSTNNGNGKYSDGRSKKIAYDLARTIEEQIVNDIRGSWDNQWSQRGIWDKGYSESRRQDAPSVLIELLSHQNLNDMHLALHPQFRFDASRAIYKGILRFFAGDSAMIEPLPVKCLGMRQTGDSNIRLSWQASEDHLEREKAKPDIYYIYANDSLIAKTRRTEIDITQTADGRIINYYVVAANRGGRSFPSKTLAASLRKGAKTALLVDGFDRVSAPDVIDDEHFRGVIDNIEPGVAWGEDLYSTGAQYDFDPNSMWLDDDAPGCGASSAEREGKKTIGSHTHQAVIAAQELYDEGYSFISQSKDYFENDTLICDQSLVRIWLDREKSTWYGDMPRRHSIYTATFLDRIETIKKSAGTIFLSGAYIGSDIQDEETARRVAKILGFTHRTNHASKTIKGINPDAIEPVKGATTIERYNDTKMSAKVRYGNVVVRGY